MSVFESFEFSHLGRAKTTFEYIMVSEAAKLTLSLQHLDRVERAIVINQQRSAVGVACSERRTVLAFRRA